MLLNESNLVSTHQAYTVPVERASIEPNVAQHYAFFSCYGKYTGLKRSVCAIARILDSVVSTLLNSSFMYFLMNYFTVCNL